MKNNFPWVMMMAAILAAGCALHRQDKAVVQTAPTVSTAIVTPDLSLAANVVSVNVVGHFVVLNFPSGQLPKSPATVYLYRAGLKVAEVKITGPEDGNNTVGDLISGDANVGDNVRDQ
jgi:hypothetical protein